MYVCLCVCVCVRVCNLRYLAFNMCTIKMRFKRSNSSIYTRKADGMDVNDDGGGGMWWRWMSVDECE